MRNDMVKHFIRSHGKLTLRRYAGVLLACALTLSLPAANVLAETTGNATVQATAEQTGTTTARSSQGQTDTTAADPAVKQADTVSTSAPDCGILTRVDEVHDGGLVRSHLEDAAGRVYDPQSDTQNTRNDSAQTSGENTPAGRTTKKATALPSSYDLRTQNLTTSIKDQGVTGCCWAFAAVKAIESYGLKAGLLTPDTADLSESHLAWFSYSPSTNTSDPMYGDGLVTASNPFSLTGSSTFPYENGGSSILAIFTLAKWSGVVAEANAPFTADTDAQMQQMALSMQQMENMRYSALAHMQQADCIDEYMFTNNYYYSNSSMITEMKQSILDNGALDIAIYYDKSYLSNRSGSSAYYQTAYTGSRSVNAANHCVTIVGWDDSYSASNFHSRPAGNGAWLIANSYGTEANDNGYFWLSYYEPSICDITSFQIEPADNYDTVYQYDGFGWSNAQYTSAGNVKTANIFTADSSSPQQLRAVSFYTLSDNQKYKIEIYRNVTSSSPISGTLIEACTTSGTITKNGYHTVTLPTTVNVAAGEKFSVVVTYIQTNGSTIYIPLEGPTTKMDSYTMQYHSKTGESYLYTSFDSNASSAKFKWYDTSSLGYNNVCVKVFADKASSATPLPNSSTNGNAKSTTSVQVTSTGLKLAKTKLTLGKKETNKLKVTSDAPVTFSSANASVAKVSSSGKITALAVGSTTITVTASGSAATLSVTVKKAPSKVTLKPSGTKKLKKGKTIRLQVKLPTGSASYSRIYSSSQPKIASVTSSGKVKALRKGTTTIKVKTYNKKTATVKIRVV